MALMSQPELGMHIREAREARGLSQTKLAELAGISRQMICHVESGVRHLSVTNYRRVLRELGTGDDGGGIGGGTTGGGGGKYFGADDGETILASAWALFYAGNGAAALPAVQMAIRLLEPQAGNPLIAATLGRAYQLAGVITRDEESKSTAQALGLRAVQIARVGASVDNLASALFRLARTHQIADQPQAAVITMREAYDLANRCRNPLRGWLLLARAETEVKARIANPIPLVGVQRWIDMARTELANRASDDMSFTALTRPGIAHIEALAVLLRSNDPARAMSVMQYALAELDRTDPAAHRWRYGMLATEAAIYAAQGDAESASACAADVLRLTRSSSHLRYLQIGKALLLAKDPNRTSKHVQRYCAVVG